MGSFTTIIAVLLVLGFTGLGVSNIVSTERQLHLHEVELKDNTADLKHLQLRYDQLNKELDAAADDKQKIEQLQKDKQELEKERQRLEQELAAKQERQRIARERTNNAASLSATASAAPAPARSYQSTGGSKEQWMAAAGIPQNQWQYVDYIVSRESSWNPNAVNRSSGACGLGQQLPCGKWAGAWNDPVAALKAQYGYVNARYGGYGGAHSFWLANHWY